MILAATESGVPTTSTATSFGAVAGACRHRPARRYRQDARALRLSEPREHAVVLAGAAAVCASRNAGGAGRLRRCLSASPVPLRVVRSTMARFGASMILP